MKMEDAVLVVPTSYYVVPVRGRLPCPDVVPAL